MIGLNLINNKVLTYGIFGVAVAMGIGYVYYLGYQRGYSRYVEFSAEVEKERAIQEAINSRVIEDNKELAIQIGNDYAKNIDAIKRYYSNRSRVLNNQGSSGSLSPVPQTPCGTDERSPNKELEGQCVETTEQLIQLQDWIKNVK